MSRSTPLFTIMLVFHIIFIKLPHGYRLNCVPSTFIKWSPNFSSSTVRKYLSVVYTTQSVVLCYSWPGKLMYSLNWLWTNGDIVHSSKGRMIENEAWIIFRNPLHALPLASCMLCSILHSDNKCFLGFCVCLWVLTVETAISRACDL